MRILKKTFEEQVEHLCRVEKWRRKDAMMKVQSDWSEEEAILSRSNKKTTTLDESYKPEESSNWHKHFGTQSIVVRRVKETRDQLLANTWNELPLESPLYELGPSHFFNVFNNYNGYIIPIIDPKLSIPNSLIAHEFVYREKFPDHEICPIKEAAFKWHDDYLRNENSIHLEDFNRSLAQCRSNLERFLKAPKEPVWADIIKTFFYMDENWQESCGFITQKDIQDYLREHGDKRYRGLSEKDRMWTAPFQKAQRFVPITSSLLGRAKTRPKMIKEAV